MDGGAWLAAVHGVAKSRTQLSDFTLTTMYYVLHTKSFHITLHNCKCFLPPVVHSDKVIKLFVSSCSNIINEMK